MPWNPEVYHKFQAQRAAPFEDLSAMITIREGLRVVDLGCGTGELTARLAEMLPGSEVLGIDNSPQMLDKAASFERPGLHFEQWSIEDFAADATQRGAWDVVFSHAALQWVPNHEGLIPSLIALLRPGGQIAVQMPSNESHFTHKTVRALAGEEPYRSALGGFQRLAPLLDIERYAEILFEQGGEAINVFEKIYPHVLENADAMADWTTGTALVPYFERLPADLKTKFDAEYRIRLREKFPTSPVFYGFRRTLFSATIPA